MNIFTGQLGGGGMSPLEPPLDPLLELIDFRAKMINFEWVYIHQIKYKRGG